MNNIFEKKRLICVGIIILIGICILNKNVIWENGYFRNSKTSIEKEEYKWANDVLKVNYRSDTEPIKKRFPELGNFKKCYWKANTIGRTNFGPVSYWMKGFVCLEEEKFEEIKNEDLWENKESNWNPEIGTEILNFSEYEWLKSDTFSSKISGSEFIGKFYLDVKNKIIYFDVESM